MQRAANENNDVIFTNTAHLLSLGSYTSLLYTVNSHTDCGEPSLADFGIRKKEAPTKRKSQTGGSPTWETEISMRFSVCYDKKKPKTQMAAMEK